MHGRSCHRLLNPNPISHVTKYIFNLGRAESTEVLELTPQLDITHYYKIEHKVDTERLEVMQRWIASALSEEFENLCYGGVKYKPIPQKQNIPPSASQVPDRYITEDVPMGLVPISGFGKMFGVPTPAIDLLIDVASFIREADYRKTGRTPERLGLAGMDAREIAMFAKTGTSSSK